MNKGALATILASSILAGCAVTYPNIPYPDVPYPMPAPRPTPAPRHPSPVIILPIPQPGIQVLKTEFRMKATGYLQNDSVRITVRPEMLGIREHLTTQNPALGGLENIERYASNAHRDKNPYNDDAAYFWERRFGRTEAFSYEERTMMTVEQTRERAQLRKLYNSIVDHVPKSYPDVGTLECVKPPGIKEFSCRMNFR